MAHIKVKRVYEAPSPEDGYRVLIDRLWPRGIRKDALRYDLWRKKLAPSTELRRWFHEDPDIRWDSFAAMYRKELEASVLAREFALEIRPYEIVTLIYAAKSMDHNHALILQRYLEDYS